MGPRLPRTPERHRGEQEERRRAERPPPHHRRLLQGRVRLDRPVRPARPVPLDGPVHPAAARHRRRPDRRAVGRGARGPLLHDADPHRRRPAQRSAAAHDRRHLPQLRARHRRHHQPAQHPAALGRHRGRPRDLGRARRRRAAHHRGVWRRAAHDHRLPAGRDRRRRGDRLDAAAPRDPRPLHRLPRVLQPAAQVQDGAVGLHLALHRPRDQRHRVRRRGERAGRDRLPAVRRRRPVHQPDVLQEPRRVRQARAGPRGVARRHLDLPRLRVPAAAQPRPAEVPDEGLGRGEVPRGAGEGLPRVRAAGRPDGARTSTATTSASTRSRAGTSTSGSRPACG